MEPSELLRWIVGVLERLDLDYLVTGSVATIFYGEPRYTADLDVVVDLPAERVRDLLGEVPGEDFYVDDESARRAVARAGQFNIVHPRSGLKIDVMVTAGDAFDESRFGRARRVRPAADLEAWFASPEDVILKKLVYYRDGGSDKHLRDVAGVFRVSGGELDRRYVEEWAGRLDVLEVWQAVVERLE